MKKTSERLPSPGFAQHPVTWIKWRKDQMRLLLTATSINLFHIKILALWPPAFAGRSMKKHRSSSNLASVFWILDMQICSLIEVTAARCSLNLCGFGLSWQWTVFFLFFLKDINAPFIGIIILWVVSFNLKGPIRKTNDGWLCFSSNTDALD